MKFKIEHQIRGRMRIHLCQKRMTCRQADQLEYFLRGLEGVTTAKVAERNQDAVICYDGDKTEWWQTLRWWLPPSSTAWRRAHSRW